MQKYNIIYVSPEDDNYLWNGVSLDKLGNDERTVLLFSGKSIKKERLKAEIEKCRRVVEKEFPEDTHPRVKPVEVEVS